MQITCKRCGAAVQLPAETQSGDVVRCGQCGKKIRIQVRTSRRRVRVPAEPVPAGPPPRRRNWALRLTALAVMGGAGFLIWRNGPPDLAAIKENVRQKIADANLIPTAAITGEAEAGETNPLAAKVAALFEQRCHRCHGAGGSDEGGFNFVLRLDKLVDEDLYVSAGAPDDSYLFSRIESGEMPPGDADQPLTAEEIALVREWIEAGAPPLTSEGAAIELVTSDDLLRLMRDDLQSLDPAVRPNTRYFTLTHLYNAGLSQDELETYRLAMAKLLNSLSWERNLVTPERVGQQETLLRINLSDLGWDAGTWDAIVDTDPYAVTVTTSDGQAIREFTGTGVPHVRADWFVSRASRAPLYYDILEIPKTLDELASRAEIGINIDQNIANDQVVRAAFIESGVSDNNRLIERHKMASGGFWVSYDFASSVGQQNVLEHPLGPDGEDAFDHDGGEIIFSLPNGLQGYMLVDGEGRRIDKGPINIVADDKQPDRAVVAGLSCMSCHANGMIRKKDEVRPTVLANRDSFPKADRILRQYAEPETLEAVLTEDANRFEAALQDIGFARLTETSEPIFHMAKRFDQAVDSSLAAAEFGLTEEAFFSELDDAPAIAKVLGVLKTPGGKVKRQQFLAVFKDAAKAFGLGVGFGEPASPASTTLAGSSAAATTPATTTTPAAATNPATAQQNAASASSGSASALPAATQAGQTPPSGAATAQPAINPQAVSSTAVAGQPAAAPDIVPPTGQPAAATQTVQVLTAEDFLHDWTRANGEPLVYASFQQVTPSGDVRVTLVPRQWKLAYDDPSYEYQAFSGTFWAFYQKLGTPVMVRIGDVSIPGALNYVDIPRDQFSEEDRDYLAHLEGLQDYAYVNKGRVRYYTFPWEAISVEDQQYVYKLIAYLTAAQPAVASVQQPPSAAAGAAPPGVPPQATEALPQSSGPPAASAPQEAPAGPSDLPVTEMVPAVEPPADSSPQGPRPPYGY